ncbi:MAG: hypothetical protein MI674_02075, partial [Cytophagales bacterium]|nr:hypothetical protein [Cytophagales bacterium]
MKNPICKHCKGHTSIKSGQVRGKQRYQCKTCKRTFVRGDERKKGTPQLQALATLLYGSGKCSLRFIGKLLKVSAPTIINWITNFGESLPEPPISEQLKEVELDEMWHFIAKKNKKYGSGEQWI